MHTHCRQRSLLLSWKGFLNSEKYPLWVLLEYDRTAYDETNFAYDLRLIPVLSSTFFKEKLWEASPCVR
jgi:hypothetical protein